MKKVNNRGFMLAEIIIVSAILATALVGLFATFSKVFIEYEKRNDYNSVDAIYASRGIYKFYNDLLSLETSESYKKKSYKKIEIKNEFSKKYKILQSYYVKYDFDALNNLANDSSLTVKFLDYVNYLKNNLDYTDRTSNYIIITEVSDKCNDDLISCEDNANVGFGYYRVN